MNRGFNYLDILQEKLKGAQLVTVLMHEDGPWNDAKGKEIDLVWYRDGVWGLYQGEPFCLKPEVYTVLCRPSYRLSLKELETRISTLSIELDEWDIMLRRYKELDFIDSDELHMVTKQVENKVEALVTQIELYVLDGVRIVDQKLEDEKETPK